jgi:hypothetical protein
MRSSIPTRRWLFCRQKLLFHSRLYAMQTSLHSQYVLCYASQRWISSRAFTGLHMGLAHGDSGGVQYCSQSRIQLAEYYVLFIEVRIL